ncbi:MAG: hypothetical protein HQM08_06520 [Candidatus Riflebacteria bacterium]|nr:hypothetical protein [Candidatus Riflebacteria bacterium]
MNKKTIYLFVHCTIFVFSAVLASFADDSAMLLDIKGDVKASLSGQEWSPSVGETLSSGCLLKIPPEAKATVAHFAMNGQYSLKGPSEIKVVENGFEPPPDPEAGIGSLSAIPDKLDLSAKSQQQIAGVSGGADNFSQANTEKESKKELQEAGPQKDSSEAPSAPAEGASPLAGGAGAAPKTLSAMNKSSDESLDGNKSIQSTISSGDLSRPDKSVSAPLPSVIPTQDEEVKVKNEGPQITPKLAEIPNAPSAISPRQKSSNHLQKSKGSSEITFTPCIAAIPAGFVQERLKTISSNEWDVKDSKNNPVKFQIKEDWLLVFPGQTTPEDELAIIVIRNKSGGESKPIALKIPSRKTQNDALYALECEKNQFYSAAAAVWLNLSFSNQSENQKKVASIHLKRIENKINGKAKK